MELDKDLDWLQNFIHFTQFPQKISLTKTVERKADDQDVGNRA